MRRPGRSVVHASVVSLASWLLCPIHVREGGGKLQNSTGRPGVRIPRRMTGEARLLRGPVLDWTLNSLARCIESIQRDGIALQNVIAVALARDEFEIHFLVGEVLR